MEAKTPKKMWVFSMCGFPALFPGSIGEAGRVYSAPCGTAGRGLNRWWPICAVAPSPGLVFLPPPNGGARSAIEGAIFKSLGVAAGGPDLLLWHSGKSLELRADGGRTSDSQADML
jgi:hypothetical protein